MRLRPRLLALAPLLGLVAFADEPTTPPPPEGLKPIGGRWFVREASGGEPATYFYRDGDRYVDLFSYHALDSNEDGVPNLSIRHDDTLLRVDSQGYPNHPTAVFPNSGNPNRIRVQDFHFAFPLTPVKADAITRVPMGPIGMAINGVVFFNPFEAGGMNAVEGYSEVWLDSCCGHPQQTGVYHYHKYPSCVKTPFSDDGEGHSPILGFAFDGFPLHGPYEGKGTLARDLREDRALDVCNGHSDPARGYHYHVTPGRFPYVIGGYAGVPEPSNSPLLRRGRVGAIENNAEGPNRRWRGVEGLTPGQAGRGDTIVLRITLDPASAPSGTPSWVQVGPFEATKVSREENVVTGEISVTRDASLGVWLDLHLEFDSEDGNGRVVVLKKNDAFRVVE
ncbi:MAG: YHYH protein [Isosphaeraceae bacterium]